MTLTYNVTDGRAYHLYQHARFGLSKEIERYGVEKNWVEKAGDIGLWTVEKFPGKAWAWIKVPRNWAPKALSCIVLAATTYGFYPAYTTQLLKELASRVALPTLGQLKFVAYVTVVFHLAAASLRLCGRLSNTELMDAWYKGKSV